MNNFLNKQLCVLYRKLYTEDDDSEHSVETFITYM